MLKERERKRAFFEGTYVGLVLFASNFEVYKRNLMVSSSRALPQIFFPLCLYDSQDSLARRTPTFFLFTTMLSIFDVLLFLFLFFGFSFLRNKKHLTHVRFLVKLLSLFYAVARVSIFSFHLTETFFKLSVI